MVGDLLVASSSLAENRVHMASVLHKLARRYRSLKLLPVGAVVSFVDEVVVVGNPV